MKDGFPLLTTKRVAFRLVLGELLWMISGSKNIKPLVDQNIHIWDEWPYQKYLEVMKLDERYPKYSDEWHKMKETFVQRIKDDPEFSEEFGNLGPVYGYKWRHWIGEGNRDGEEVDQLEWVIDRIKNDPQNRRLIVTAWDPSVLNEVALPPCHMYFHLFVGIKNDLECLVYQRSVDTFLGLPFNLASYAALTMIIAQVCGLTATRLVWIGGDVHIYNNHEKQVYEQLGRTVRSLPTLRINPEIMNIDDLRPEHFNLEEYNPHPAIKAPISV